jgi:eukaryotic-like serine/threonine-protein kinase
MSQERPSSETVIFGLPSGRSSEPASDRDALEVLATQFIDAVREGKEPNIESYVAAHPDLAGDIRELFPMLTAMEGWKAYRERTSFEHRMLDRLPNGRCGDFDIVREVGRGGMGIVFEARDRTSGRQVAIKVLPFFKSDANRERFEREARTASALRHRHIVPVYAFGEHEGTCYYVMRLIRGAGLDWVIQQLGGSRGAVYARNIADRFESSRPPQPSDSGHRAFESAGSTPELDAPAGRISSHDGSTRLALLSRNSWLAIARIGAQVADALHHAHRCGTLHRDIKPANLLLDADGEMWVTDFGLAQDLDQLLNRGDTAPAGTLRYVAPEVLAGRVDVRSDIYSLGITLYELATRTPAFDSPDRKSLLDRITRSQLPRPRQLNPRIPRDLEAIVLKATAKDAALRYASAADLVADLLRFHRGQRVRARGRFGWLRLPQ